MLSIAINVKNGARHLDKCLNALRLFDNVVLLDNYSTDNTLAIAGKYPNVCIFSHEFCGMGPLRNILSTHAKYDWVFFVDSDEVLSPELVKQLLQMQFVDGHVYSVFRHNFYNNCWLDGAAWGNDWVSRIYNRRQTKYSDAEVHESINVQGLQVDKIHTGFIYHFPYENARQLLDKLQFYSTLYAEQNRTKKVAKLYQVPFRTWFMFIKCFILKRGFRYGFDGFLVSIFNAMGVAVKYLKLYELQHQCRLGLAVKLPQNIIDAEVLVQQVNSQVLLPHKLFLLTSNSLDVVNIADSNAGILQLIQQKLVVPIITVAALTDINKNNPDMQLDHVIDIANTASLSKPTFLKQCKKLLLNNQLSCKMPLSH